MDCYGLLMLDIMQIIFLDPLHRFFAGIITIDV